MVVVGGTQALRVDVTVVPTVTVVVPIVEVTTAVVVLRDRKRMAGRKSNFYSQGTYDV